MNSKSEQARDKEKAPQQRFTQEQERQPQQQFEKDATGEDDIAELTGGSDGGAASDGGDA